MESVVDNHLETTLGASYKDLAAAKEEDNASRTTDLILFIILILGIFSCSLLILFRTAVSVQSKREAIKQFQAQQPITQ